MKYFLNSARQENKTLKCEKSFTNQKSLNESYENLMQEQFIIMKESFTKEIEKLNKGIVKKELEFKKKIIELEEELNETKRVKELFMKQIFEFQKMIM